MDRRDTALKYFEQQSAETALRQQTGIELYRKGSAQLLFETADGSPLPENITVEARQTNHEFRFGANLFMLDEFETPEKNAIYREKFPEVFNLATVPFYWRDLEPEQGKPGSRQIRPGSTAVRRRTSAWTTAGRRASSQSATA